MRSINKMLWFSPFRKHFAWARLFCRPLFSILVHVVEIHERQKRIFESSRIEGLSKAYRSLAEEKKEVSLMRLFRNNAWIY